MKILDLQLWLLWGFVAWKGLEPLYYNIIVSYWLWSRALILYFFIMHAFFFTRLFVGQERAAQQQSNVREEINFTVWFEKHSLVPCDQNLTRYGHAFLFGVFISQSIFIFNDWLLIVLISLTNYNAFIIKLNLNNPLSKSNHRPRFKPIQWN